MSQKLHDIEYLSANNPNKLRAVKINDLVTPKWWDKKTNWQITSKLDDKRQLRIINLL
jgi:hypothetical protein